MNILLDTNFLIYLVKYKIIDSLMDLNPELVIPGQVFDEVSKIAKQGKGKDNESARLALTLIEKWIADKKLVIDKTIKGYTDEALLKIAKSKKERIYVATLDNDIIKKLKKAKISILRIRQKKYLMFD